MEQEMKQRQFVEQKKKLQEFSSIGKRKIDPESYMKSLIGDGGSKPGGQKGQPAQGQHPPLNTNMASNNQGRACIPSHIFGP